MGKAFVENDIEILVATMNRTSLDFLAAMFPFNHFSNYNILIVNQSKTNNLQSDYPSVRVFNSTDFGLSKSRNIALDNAVGKVLLIADDDVVYQKDFISKIITAYHKYENATAIRFCAANEEGFFLKKYPIFSKQKLNIFDVFNVSSIEITLNKERLDFIGIRFDENFGLGSEFEMGEEAIFLLDLKQEKQQISFENQILVNHNNLTSSSKIEILDKYYIQGAFLTRALKNNYAFYLITKLFFDLKQNKIKFGSLLALLKRANQGRKKMKSLQQRII
jgi:glycosyltransferase involved in cell wall biosynthesis